MTIKDWIGKAKYDPHGQMIFSGEDEQNHIADIRGWGSLQYEFKTNDEAAEFMDSVGRFIVDAINEKLEREKE